MNMELEEFEKDEKLFSQGDIGTKFYMIMKGSVSIHIPQKVKVCSMVLQER
jgi:CRP-like cAMP-binding protein